MNQDEILSQLKSIILPYIPESDDKVQFGSKAYPDVGQIGIERISSEKTSEYIEISIDETCSLHNLMLNLQKCQNFSSEPWTHFQAIVYRSGHIDWQSVDRTVSDIVH
ncbi:hypothetical protein LNQ82_06510 [Conchiformibius steedae DSM 2580]|uniref:Uncharacterized protein n=1 Tax=Conchiformibius steedae DSM 2580 TaxID=1121352 RepID=A0AAE9HRM4_9NEIS|nr:hypothetical protein [Conchiformibius steedae]QMT34096.1 hypothetical protein H3L98_03590 [Conchiformibius steedae]URD66869.1 hypothetical protein LNQ82_06510 [Conchiformibius steedae DSM 2580]